MAHFKITVSAILMIALVGISPLADVYALADGNLSEAATAADSTKKGRKNKPTDEEEMFKQ